MAQNSLPQSFQSNRRFYDDTHFPRGFGRYGTLTIAEARLLETHGHALKALHYGIQPPETDEETRFVEVTRGQAGPLSPIERAWMKYLSLINRGSRFHSAFGRGKSPAPENQPDNMVILDSDD